MGVAEGDIGEHSGQVRQIRVLHPVPISPPQFTPDSVIATRRG